eukprot:COSAG02_NODE_2341_length_9104_cov_2.666185_1_plen_71_part_10
MEFLRTAFGLSIVQWKSLAARAASGQLWDEPLVQCATAVHLASKTESDAVSDVWRENPIRVLERSNAAES